MNTLSLFEEAGNTMLKMQDGYKTFQHTPKVEVGTTPKTLVWQMDKVKI